jgi:hypothetical protein
MVLSEYSIMDFPAGPEKSEPDQETKSVTVESQALILAIFFYCLLNP